jgi:hypothetical protein
MKVARLSVLRTGRLYPRKYFWYSFLLEAESTPGPEFGWKDYVNEKNPVTQSGIEPATFQFVVQCLNHYATACPNFIMSDVQNLNCEHLQVIMKTT